MRVLQAVLALVGLIVLFIGNANELPWLVYVGLAFIVASFIVQFRRLRADRKLAGKQQNKA
ncbi:hypothetical protein FLK61_25330 [Paenalkalicoccus suaedae]|uniref:Uncharacterized protein n=1 Tax=Paenalkalicoccus suaedae TaxID=2592382 RepID=A0A859FAU1_9BACI|nr:hypothetical protein [Paenalkalicoccus suaedae]QKS70097.1 hypothetical protein FLK61_25330 [Paenalkalicoccus suaedae]